MINIIITGSNGFIGNQLTNYFGKIKGINVYPIDIVDNKNKRKIIKIDLNDRKKLFNFFKNKKVDYIYHLASISDIDYSVKYPYETLKNNIFSLINILDLALDLKIKKFIFSSTIYTKGNKGSFYRISKKTCEDIILEFNRLKKLKFLIIRYGSVYGHGAPDTNSLYNLAQQIKRSKTVIRKGTGNEVRSYINIYDAIEMTAKLIHKKYVNLFIDITGSKPIKSSSLLNFLQKKYLKNKFIFDGKENFHHYKTNPSSKVNFKNRKLIIKKDIKTLKKEIYDYILETNNEK